MSCQICGSASGGGQFCVSCGQLLESTTSAVTTRERDRSSRNPWMAFHEIRLLACPKCGAPNSAARWQCARCGHKFNDAAGDEPSGDGSTQPGEAVAVQPESAPWVALITVVVGVAAVAVAVALLASRGAGPFGRAEEASAVPQFVPAPVDKVRASSAAPGAEAALVSDGDTATAWRTDGTDRRNWIELHLENGVLIDHLLIWNGDQHDVDTFADTGRVGRVLIDFRDVGRSYTVTFPDRTGNFRVDMPNPPVSSRIRIRVQSVYGDSGQAALSEVEALVSASAAGTE